MTVIPLNARTAARLAELSAEPSAEYVTLPPAARNAMTALKARIGDLDRIFAGSATPKAMAERIDALCAEAVAELQRVRRFSR